MSDSQSELPLENEIHDRNYRIFLIEPLDGNYKRIQ